MQMIGTLHASDRYTLLAFDINCLNYCYFHCMYAMQALTKFASKILSTIGTYTLQFASKMGCQV